MLIGFKTELKPNNKQITAFKKHCGIARHAWNHALAHTKLILDINRLAKSLGESDQKVKFPSAIDLNKWHCREIKKANPWYYECSKAAHQNAIRSLRVSWDRCFKKISGPPKFKKKGKCRDTFTLDGSISCQQKAIKLPRIGWVKTFEELPNGFKPKNATISRDGSKWFVSFRLEVEPIQQAKTKLAVGIDLGLKTFGTLSNGEILEAPITEYKRIKAKIAKLQYVARNKTKGSTRWQKAMQKIQKLHYKAKCIRLDFLHKSTTYLAKNFSVICLEDLNIKGMMANHKLAGAISLMGWHEFRRQLEYKCKLYESELVFISRWEPSSKTCSQCGWKKEDLTLKDRIFDCKNCGSKLDRDFNAALNILKIGLGLSSLRNVDTVAPTPVVEAFSKQLILDV